MNITCRSCGRAVDHASPGCAEHASREAAEIHRAHVASGGSADHCPVCARPAAASRSERRQGMGAELDRMRAELASAQQENREWREQAARTRNEVAELLPDDPAGWGPGDVAYALVQARAALTAAREDVALLRVRSREAAATIDTLTRELAEARAALREYATRCEGHECDEIATRREPYSYGARACDACITKYTSQPEDLPHAAALRAAVAR